MAEIHSVYLAGKIEKNGWREKLFDARSVGTEGYTLYGLSNHTEVGYSGRIEITGPFFISCDHGCYHGEGKHGVGAVKHEIEKHGGDPHYDQDDCGGCMGEYFTRDDVFEISKNQIKRADIVFAYIDSPDCYGTLAEIGYAYALRKDIVIVFSNDELKEKMWFIDKMQRNTAVASYKWISTELISKFKEEK